VQVVRTYRKLITCQSLDPENFFMQLSGRVAVNQFSTLLERNIRNYFQHRIFLVGASRVLVTYSWLHVECRVIYQHNKASCRASESLAQV